MKPISTFLFAVLFVGQVYAKDFTIENLKYTIIGHNTVSVGKAETNPEGEVIIPARVENKGIFYSVTSIDSGAFESCHRLKSIVIPNTITDIKDYAFINCYSLVSVSIPKSVTSIGMGAFAGCRNLIKVDFASIESLCAIKFEGDVSNPLCYAKHLYINGEKITKLNFPDSINEIGDYAFVGCEDIISITIPVFVKRIGKEAFKSCIKVTEINVESSNTDYIAEDGVLFNKDKTELICFPAGKTGSYNIPNSVTNIWAKAFYNSGLTSVIIPKSVKSIGNYAFAYCNNLKIVDIPNSVSNIDYGAFWQCTNLTTITIPSSVEIIEYGAFGGCKNLTIHCELDEEPYGWELVEWNGDDCPVVWGEKIDQDK